ncbi:PAS domain S-box protein [Phenylobacterium sp.]|uniref:PAS domain S-box protein n=1 Tax=Phenylobacterium sp. TaxID=1871053 RepID=UPI002ED86CD9
MRLSALALGAFALALACILFTRDHGQVAAIWPGNALALAILLRLPPRAWPAYTAAAVAGLTAANLAVGDSLLRALSFAVGNGAEILLAAAIARRLAGPAPDVTRPRHLMALAAAGVLAPIVSAASGTAIIGGDPLQVMAPWYLSDALGLILITPALTALAVDHGSLRAMFARRRNLAPVLALAAALALVFGQQTYSFFFVLFPPLVWCAFSLGAAGTALVLLITIFVAVVSTLSGYGSATTIPGGLPMQLAVLQVLLATVSLVTLPLTAVLAERRRLDTSLREALARIGESEARYRMLADNATDVILKIDASAVVRYASPSIAQFGYAADDLIGRPVFEFIHPEDYGLVTARAGAMAKTGAVDPQLERAYRVRTKDGRFVWAEGNPTIVRNAEGQFEAVVTQIRDISARKEAEAATAESEARYRVLADHATDVILKVDAEDTILYVSPSVTRYGYDPEQLVGRSGYSIVHPDDAPKLRALLAELFRAGVVNTTRDRTYRIRTADGGWVWMEGNPSLVRNDADEVVAVISQLRDVSARLELEDQLKQARDEAEAAAAAKADFMANMSHEIRTPLTAILGFTSLLEGRQDLTDEARYQLGRIGGAGQALLAIVNDILDFSKLEAGLMPIRRKPVAARDMLGEAIGLFEPQAAEKGLTLSFAPTDDLPAYVSLDPDRLRQVLLNLIGNAVKFTEAGAVTVTVSYAGDRLRVAVKDSGAGMDAEQQAKLFQRYSQVDGSMAKAGRGTGLGLAICRGLVEAMGGEIGVTSAVGEGSTFAFEIPAPACEVPTAALGDDAAPTGLSGLRVLLADDNALNRELTASVLAPFEIEVTAVEDGAAAVELAQMLPYDVILLDIRMPVMDGPEAARRIRGAPGPNRDAPILAFSADHELGEAAAGLFDGHVRKPIDVAALLEALAEVTAWEEALAAEG